LSTSPLVSEEQNSLISSLLSADDEIPFRLPPSPEDLITSTISFWNQDLSGVKAHPLNQREESNSSLLDSQLVNCLFLNDRSLWESVHSLVAGLDFQESALAISDEDQMISKPISVFELCVSIFSGLSVSVTRSITSSLVKQIEAESFLPVPEAILNIACTCWCGIRFQYPRHCDLQTLVTQMSIDETILLAEASLMILRQTRLGGEEHHDTLPSFLGAPSDFIAVALIHWQEQGIYNENQLQLTQPGVTFGSAEINVDCRILQRIRCHWITILFLLEDTHQNLITGKSNLPLTSISFLTSLSLLRICSRKDYEAL
jgi:hypothetical protein